MTQSGSISAELVRSQHLCSIGERTDRHVTGIAYFGFAAFRTFLGGNKDDTIGSTGTVDSGSGSVLEDGEALDIVRVDHGEWVRYTLNTILIHSETIDDDQRAVGSVKGSTTTNSN